MSQINRFGNAIKQLRKSRKLPLRTVAAYLDIDQAILSKIESGQRKATRDLVVKLASYFQTGEDEMLSLWLSDKILYAVEGEKMAQDALRIAEQSIYYNTAPIAIRTIIEKIHTELKKDGRVLKAWIFGSFAREEQTPGSDIDLIVRFREEKKISLFDLADISHNLGKVVGIPVDLVEEVSIPEEMLNAVNKEKILVYG